MSERTILRMGDPRLLRVARVVEEADWSSIPELLEDMRDSMDAAGGTGLAAPQIGVDLRVVIFEVAADRDGGIEVPLTVLINPQIDVVNATLEPGLEGCLSVPGMRGVVDRPVAISYTGVDENHQSIHRQASGFHARVVQHEVDHLDGILYPMRIKDLSLFGFSDELTQRPGT